ncbi:ULK3 [Symbiodinium sp. KB8]|nr:ULK3 [Symbiodinium sp. KB8]
MLGLHEQNFDECNAPDVYPNRGIDTFVHSREESPGSPWLLRRMNREQNAKRTSPGFKFLKLLKQVGGQVLNNQEFDDDLEAQLRDEMGQPAMGSCAMRSWSGSTEDSETGLKGWRRRFLIGALFLTVVALLLMIVYAAGASNRLNLVNDLRNAVTHGGPPHLGQDTGRETWTCHAKNIQLWTPQQREWCCQEEHVGCAATSLPFDCLDGLSKFKKWSAEKRQWLLGVASGISLFVKVGSPAICEQKHLPWSASWLTTGCQPGTSQFVPVSGEGSQDPGMGVGLAGVGDVGSSDRELFSEQWLYRWRWVNQPLHMIALITPSLELGSAIVTQRAWRVGGTGIFERMLAKASHLAADTGPLRLQVWWTHQDDGQWEVVSMGSCASVQNVERSPFYARFILQEKIGQAASWMADKSLIGRHGSYGKVYLVKDKRNQKILAVKVQAAQFGREWVITDEVNIWRSLGRHPNIVSFHDLRQEANVYFILMEDSPSRYQGCELVRVSAAFQAAASFEVQNFLYGGRDDRTLKLADFGLSVHLRPGEKLDAVCGSPAFMAPEMVMRQGYEFKIDMWSMGVTFFMVMYGTLLVGKPKMSVPEMKEAIKSPTATKTALQGAMQKADTCEGEERELKHAALDVVKQLTVREPTQRVGPKDALDLPFIHLVAVASEEDLVVPGGGGGSSGNPPFTTSGERQRAVNVSDSGQGKRRAKSSNVIMFQEGDGVAKRPSDRIQLPDHLDSPNSFRGMEGGASSLKLQRFKSSGLNSLACMQSAYTSIGVCCCAVLIHDFLDRTK